MKFSLFTISSSATSLYDSIAICFKSSGISILLYSKAIVAVGLLSVRVIDIVEPDMSKLKGTVASIVFKGVHYEIMVATPHRDYKIHTTDYHEVGKAVGLRFEAEDVHVMYKMEN